MSQQEYQAIFPKQEHTMAAYDAIIIGAGQAGPPLARHMAGSGMQIGVVERGRFDGTCVNTASHRRKPWSPVRMPRTWPAVAPETVTSLSLRWRLSMVETVLIPASGETRLQGRLCWITGYGGYRLSR